MQHHSKDKKNSKQESENENEELDVFYLYFGIIRQIIWQISPKLRNYMLEE
jgi:hypothetical protein